MDKLSYFSPIPPLPGGISDYSYELLEELSKLYETTVFIDQKIFLENKSYSVKKISGFKKEGSRILCNIGNNYDFCYVYNFLLKNSGNVLLHDLNLHSLNYGMLSNGYWSLFKFFKNLYFCHGLRAIFDFIKLGLMYDSRFSFLFGRSYAKKISDERGFSIKGINDTEEDKGQKFRWTKRKTKFLINDSNISEIAFKVKTEFSAIVLINVNNKQHYFLLRPHKYKWIRIKTSLIDSINCSLTTFKPLSFISNLLNNDPRSLGIRLYSLCYKSKNKIKFVEMFSKLNSFQESFEKIKFKEAREILHNKIRFNYFMNKMVINSVDSIIVHNNYMKKEIKKINSSVPVKVIRHGSFINVPFLSKEKIKNKLGLKEKFIVCFFGSVQYHKRIEPALTAFKDFLKFNKDSLFVICGSLDPEYDIESKVQELDLQKNVIFTGYVPRQTSFEYIYSSDICVNLRYPSTGATSGSLIDILSVGRPCIISDLPENEEFSSSCVFKVKKDVNEVKNIKNIFEKIYKNKKLKDTMSKSALNYIEKNHLWKDKAKEIKSFLENSNENSNF